MSANEMFESALRSKGDSAGVFEYDGETGYFYLYETKVDEDQRVVGAIRVLSKRPDFEEKDIVVRWNATEEKVGLFIRGELWAAFDGRTGTTYGGNYCAGAQAKISSEITRAFELR